MQDLFRRHTKLIIGLLIVIFTGIIAWSLIYTFILFHVTSISPSGPEVSRLQPQIVIKFNKELSNKGLSVKIDDLPHKTAIQDDTLTISFDNYMKSDKTYIINIESIQSSNGDRIENHIFQITATDNDSLLSEEDAQIVLDRQDNKTGLFNDPIYKYLPYSTLDYVVEASGGTDVGEVASIEITIELSAADAKSSRDAAVAKYRQAAIDYLSNLEGIDISKYQITTTVIDPIL